MTTIAPEQRPAEASRDFAGRSVPRKEDDRLVQGQGVYFDDRRRHGAGYVHLVRSPYAHARIARIDVSKAEALDGVYGTLTGDEVATLTDPYFQLQLPPANEIKDYCMAVGKARYMGEPVVAVVAATRDLARDAADLVEVEYEPLGVNIDARRARDPDTAVMHDEAGGNLVWEGRFDWGDIDGALSAADRVVRIDELHFHRFSSTPIELCGAIAEYEPATGQFSLYCNHQFPGMALVFMAPALRVGMDRIRFVTHDIGGGFGNKVIMHTYLLICCLLARKLGRPVHWTEWRTDNHMANTHGNERWFQDIEVAVQDDGTIVGFRMKAIDDCGAYPRYEPIGCVVWSQVTTGCYRISNVRVDFEQVCTNKSPCGPNRGYSRLQHLWFVERMLDIVAHELAIDPVEMRKRNYVRADEMPYTTVNGCVYDSGDYTRSLDRALELVNYDDVRERQRRREPDDKVIGIGIGSTLDSGTNNFAQARLVNPQLPFSGNNEAATVKLDLFGEIVVTLGTAPQGQGHETTASQVVADVLGVTPTDVHVRPGFDSFHNSHVTFSGTYASQFAVTGLGAVKGATEKLANELRELAAWALGTTPDEIVLENGAAKVRGNPDTALTFMECASIVNAANADLPEDMDVTLNCRHVYRPKFEPLDVERRFGNLTLTYASQVHVCVVEIDPETGELEIVDYAVVDDCGTRVNPRIVEGQVHGATAHAVGAALHEAFIYNDDGLLLTSNFLDYHAIRALEMPDVKTAEIESPSPFTPLGAKGLGEGGGGGLHAVAAAIQDALAQVGGGIVHDSFNNSERIYRLLHAPETSRSLVHVEA